MVYEIKCGHKSDFKVVYHFYDQAEGGRQTTPYQGYRSDFWYQNPEHTERQIFMIWPEFEDEYGNVIIDEYKQIKKNGAARMWIIMPKMRSYHQDKIKVGLKGYFMEGSKRVAECEVVEIIDLYINPREPLEVNGKLYQ